MTSAYKIAPTVTPTKLYEINYYKLLQLFPQLKACQQVESEYVKCSDKSLQIKIVEQHKYTSTLNLYKLLPVKKNIKMVDILLRLYHDVKLIEVISFQGSKKLKKYENYPNIDMYLADEKKQLNIHLGFILDLSIKKS
jgi:uncharacterized protein